MNRHRLSAVQLTQFYLHRIKKLNLMLHAAISVSPRASVRARQAKAHAQENGVTAEPNKQGAGGCRRSVETALVQARSPGPDGPGLPHCKRHGMGRVFPGAIQRAIMAECRSARSGARA